MRAVKHSYGVNMFRELRSNRWIFPPCPVHLLKVLFGPSAVKYTLPAAVISYCHVFIRYLWHRNAEETDVCSCDWPQHSPPTFLQWFILCVCVCPCLHVRQSGDSSVFPKFVHKPKGLLEACWCPLLAKKISTFNLNMAAFYWITLDDNGISISSERQVQGLKILP